MFVSLTADMQQYERGWAGAVSTTEQGAARIRRSSDLAVRSVTSLERSMSGSGAFRPGALLAAGRAFEGMSSQASLLRGVLLATTGAFAGFTGALTANVVARYADTYTNLSNQVRAVSKTFYEAQASIGGVSDVADRSRSSLASTGTLFSRISKALPDMDPADVLRYVETIQKALQLGGATAQESASAAIQFSQAIASGRLGGEEFRAIMETPLGMELAKGLGVTVGKLREMSIAGELTASTVLGALEKIAPSIDKSFGMMVPSLDQHLAVLDNRLILYVGSVDKAYGVTRQLGSAISAFGNNLETIIPLLATIGGLAAAMFTGRLLASPLTAISGRFKAEVGARAEALKEAKAAAVEAERKLVDAGLARSRAAANTFGDQAQFAPSSSLAALKREQESLSRLEQERLMLLERQKTLQTDVAAVTATTSARVISLTEKRAAAEERVSAGLARQAELRDQIVAAAAREANLTNMKELGFAGSGDVTAATRARIELEKSLAKVVKDTDAARMVADGRAAQIAALRTDAEVAAANKRLDLLRSEADVRRQLSLNYVMRQGVGEDAGKAYTSAYAAGSAKTRDALRSAEAGLADTRNVYTQASADLSKATKAASGAAIAISGVKAAGSGLVAFLGGPWGVAFTAATVALSYLGIRALKEAQDIAAAREIIRRALKDRDDGSAPATALSAWKARQEQLKGIGDDATKVREEISRLNAVFADAAMGAVSSLFRTDQSAAAINLRNAVVGLIVEVKNGSISMEEFDRRLSDLGLSGDVLAKLRAEAAKVKPEVDMASAALSELKVQADKLNGTVIGIRIAVIGADALYGVNPFGISEAAKMAGPDAGLQDSISRFRERLISESKRSTEATKVETKAWEIYNDAVKSGLTRAEGGYTLADAMATAQAVVQNEKAVRDSEKSAGAAAKAYEKLQDALARLKEEAQGAFLGDVDRAVLAQAKKMKFSAADMESYRLGAQNDNMAGVPRDMITLRDAETAKAAAESYRSLIQQYGTGAQLADAFAQKQRELDYLVANNKITRGQAREAMADYMAQFREFSWINDFTSSVSRFAESAVTDFGNVGEAARALAQDIAKMILKITVLQPLESGLKGSLGGLMGGGGGGLLGGLFASIFHDGSPSVGSHAAPMRAMPSSAFRYAPRFHSGLLPGEMSAILKRGEAVLNNNLTQRVSGTMAGLAEKAGGAVSSITYAPVIDARGADAAAVGRIETALATDRAAFQSRVIGAVNEAIHVRGAIRIRR